jgi:sulfoxide reductase heme-binding subunit YedZ
MSSSRSEDGSERHAGAPRGASASRSRPWIVTRVVKPALFALALVPLGVLVYRTGVGDLGANPVETLTHETGRWGLRLLLLTLAVTPLRRLTGWGELVRLRRMLGLLAFLYLTLHFFAYAWLDQAWVIADIVEDVARRPYVTLGFTALLLLVPLAATSTDGMIRRLGGRRWKRLHQLVYVAAVAGCLHYLWLVKADTRDPLVYLVVLTLLLAARHPALDRPARGPRQPARPGSPG